ARRPPHSIPLRGNLCVGRVPAVAMTVLKIGLLCASNSTPRFSDSRRGQWQEEEKCDEQSDAKDDSPASSDEILPTLQCHRYGRATMRIGLLPSVGDSQWLNAYFCMIRPILRLPSKCG